MRAILILVTLFTALAPIEAASARIIKTLPHYLDLEGRHTIHPSLFERDVYQAELKKNPDQCSGMRFDVQWKGRELKGQPVRVRLEVRGMNTPPRQSEVFEQEIKAKGRVSQWTSIEVAGDKFSRTGQILAWRVTLWSGQTQLAEQKSFLW